MHSTIQRYIITLPSMEDNYKQRGLRRRLVEILREKGIQNESILSAVNTIARHHFFPPEFLQHAYQDKAFPIGEGQTISQPYTVAIQTELCLLAPGQKVLEIGTGSGYQCCILKALGVEVYTIEFHRKLYQQAKLNLLKWAIRHISFVEMDQWTEKACSI